MAAPSSNSGAMEVVEPSSPTEDEEEEEEEQSSEPRPRTRSNPEGAEDRALGAQASVGSRSEGEGEAASADDGTSNPPGAGPKPWQVPLPAPEIQVRTPRVNCPEKVIICLDLSEEMSLPKLESFNGSKTNALNVSQKMIEMFVRTKHKIDKSHEFALVVVNDDIAWLSGLTSDPRELCSCLYDLETASCSTFNLEGLFSLIQQKTELPVTENVQTIPPPYVVRTILVYSRLPCQPQFSPTEPMKKMFQCPYFFFDIVYIHNGTDEKEEEMSWKVSGQGRCAGGRTCLPSWAAWIPRVPATSMRWRWLGQPWSYTTAWPSCWLTRCSGPARATPPTACWRRTTTPPRSRPLSEASLQGQPSHTMKPLA
ncbi:BRISC and BRCA1-A complex member 1 isoform X1 [Diceros bicornis minor]|uniref:BRISC and BRCA1-A complex member 1 isoform X1 n=1 Tax=Diceros bicornis minor TaxID=77932 RepID=UPI0026ED6517|nr:BRISC and BRCA1-A complex member 1 isoform X1 [Diceros bicornis minor]XP_058419649.1 BRISC and BRCA1-A complex member 1 isoform X1 [Diceros bicornis minor]